MNLSHKLKRLKIHMEESEKLIKQVAGANQVIKNIISEIEEYLNKENKLGN